MPALVQLNDPTNIPEDWSNNDNYLQMVRYVLSTAEVVSRGITEFYAAKKRHADGQPAVVEWLESLLQALSSHARREEGRRIRHGRRQTGEYSGCDECVLIMYELTFPGDKIDN